MFQSMIATPWTDIQHLCPNISSFSLTLQVEKKIDKLVTFITEPPQKTTVPQSADCL